ncbi:hypothetical protein CDIK_1395 [Cucumispora dikerogammari]|nr:hypothetical protein CDIK_1395 [Cucumispora dikerogammari]
MEILSNPDLLSGQILQLNTTIRLVDSVSEQHISVDSLTVEETVVNANEPDIFTMIPLKQLILEARQLKKDFILAKIISDAPNNSEDFNYYYHAPELNKVLFKFESERRLLHRMKVRNPLNNLYIIGKVLYYKITPKDIDEKINEKVLELKKQFELDIKNSSNKSFHDDNESFDTGPCDDIGLSEEEGELVSSTPDINNSSRDSRESLISIKKKERIIKNVLEEVNEHSVGSLLESNKHVSSKFPSNDDIQYLATFVGTDDDFLTKASMREYFRKNSDESDEFIFELDRRNNDLIALLETGTDAEDDPTGWWKRVFSIHITMLMGMMVILLLLGSNPLVILVVFPVAVVVLISFLCTIIYILCIRRTTFDSLAVESVDDI